MTDPYLGACARLGVAAGRYVIGVPSIGEQNLEEADLVVHALGEADGALTA